MMIIGGTPWAGLRWGMVRIAIAAVASVVLGCGGSQDRLKVSDEAAPATAELARAWAEERVREALARHGQFDADAWTSAYWGAQQAEERMMVIDGIEVSFEPSRDASTAAVRGNAWKGRITLDASRHRFTEQGGPSQAPDWIAGAGPLSGRVLYVRRKKSGRILWATAPADSPPLPDEVYSPDERDVLASLLQEFQSPRTPREQRVIARRIATVLRHDAETLQQAGAAVGRPADVNAGYIQRIEVVDLSELPAEFVSAYREHVDAWRTGEKSRIEVSWASVAAIANRYGVGTYN